SLGWTGAELGVLWLGKDFHPQMAIVSSSGHNLHCTYRLLSFALARKIIIVCLPPNTTHALQP
ncbi:hypothetical protein FPV67DRAFT_1400111, partial [Lyophyllum atratum]